MGLVAIAIVLLFIWAILPDNKPSKGVRVNEKPKTPKPDIKPPRGGSGAVPKIKLCMKCSKKLKRKR